MVEWTLPWFPCNQESWVRPKGILRQSHQSDASHGSQERGLFPASHHVGHRWGAACGKGDLSKAEMGCRAECSGWCRGPVMPLVVGGLHPRGPL